MGSPYTVPEDTLEKLRSMGLALATGNGLAITDEGLRRIEAGE